MTEPSVFFTNNEPVKELATVPGSIILDAGWSTPCAWSTGKTLVEQMIFGQGEVVFGDIADEGCKMVTLDMFLDAPALLPQPVVTELETGVLHYYPDLALSVALLQGGCPVSWPENCGTVLAVRYGGLVSAIYLSYLVTARAVHGCLRAGYDEHTLLWGWSSAVLPALCEQADTFAFMVDKAEKASTVSFWVRNPQDEPLVEQLESYFGAGELRLQNMSTGNTFVRGRYDLSTVES